MVVAADQLIAEAGAVAGHLAGGLAGLGQVPADAAGAAQYGRFVADREDGGEADAEAADARAGPGGGTGGGAGGRALGGRPERRQGFDAGGVEGAPVLAAARTWVPALSCRVRRRRPSVPARDAASAAFWASSTMRRSR